MHCWQKNTCMFTVHDFDHLLFTVSLISIAIRSQALALGKLTRHIKEV
jgi:hypothetical protein